MSIDTERIKRPVGRPRKAAVKAPEEVSEAGNMSVEAVELLTRMLPLCSVSTSIFAKTFFPERFTLPFAPAIHDRIFELTDGPDNLVCIGAPRGFGKTSCIGLGLIARYILFRKTPFVVYINKSHDAASLQTENLRRELIVNRYIRALSEKLGKVKPEPGLDGFEESFSKKSWVAMDTLVWPRGARQQVRGVLHKNSRPGLFVLDDIEDPEFITNEDYRKKLYEWLYADVMKAVPQVGPEALTYKIVYIDTLKHEDSTLQKLLDAPDWKSIRLEACDENFEPTAPEFMSKEKILKEWEAYSAAGQADVFYREMRNIPISTRDAAFRPEYFRYYNLLPNQPPREGRDLGVSETEVNASPGFETVVIVDPAKTAKMDSADSAIVGIGIDLTSRRLYIRDIDNGKMLPDDLYARAFEMAKRLGAHAVGWEVSGLEEFIKQPVKNAMHTAGLFFELVWLRARGGTSEERGKAHRIQGLVPYYRQGQVYHNAQCATVKKLEEQLLMFPRSRLWDIMDATAYIVEMLELGDRYFTPLQSPEATAEDEYMELEYDAPLSNWQLI